MIIFKCDTCSTEFAPADTYFAARLSNQTDRHTTDAWAGHFCSGECRRRWLIKLINQEQMREKGLQVV